MRLLLFFWSASQNAIEADQSSTNSRSGGPFTAVGLDEQDDQKNRRNQDEHEAGNEAEIVGFHGRLMMQGRTYHRSGASMSFSSPLVTGRSRRIGFSLLFRPLFRLISALINRP